MLKHTQQSRPGEAVSDLPDRQTSVNMKDLPRQSRLLRPRIKLTRLSNKQLVDREQIVAKSHCPVLHMSIFSFSLSFI